VRTRAAAGRIGWPRIDAERPEIVTTALNEFFDGKWVAPVWQPSKGIEHCIGCHGPGTPTQKPAGGTSKDTCSA
jgi:hypothetical protein